MDRQSISMTKMQIVASSDGNMTLSEPILVHHMGMNQEEYHYPAGKLVLMNCDCEQSVACAIVYTSLTAVNSLMWWTWHQYGWVDFVTLPSTWDVMSHASNKRNCSLRVKVFIYSPTTTFFFQLYLQHSLGTRIDIIQTSRGPVRPMSFININFNCSVLLRSWFLT